MPSSLLHPRHFFSSDQPLSYNLFGPPNLLPRHASRHMSMHVCLASMVFLRSKAWIGASHTPSFSSSHSCRADRFFQYIILALPQKHLFHTCVQTTLMSNTTFAKNSKAYQCGHSIPKSQVSHTTAPASPRTCLQVCSSNICFLQACCCSLHHLPNQTPSSQESVGVVESFSSNSNLFNSIKSESEPNSFPAGAALCLLNFRLSAGAMPTACPSTTSSNQSS